LTVRIGFELDPK
jgi:hypothetical protein